MKTVLNIARFIVGVLFIFSGLIKANDPLGLSFKMQEFFEIWGWHFLNDYALAFSVAMIAFEIIAGVAVLVGWQMRLFSWLLLLLILFFTFLTGYAVFSGKVRECGCFGDCIPLTANQSFLKDLILLVLIGIVFAYRKQIQPAISARNSIVVLFFATIFSFAFQWFVLLHLPIMDCLPFKKGSNILVNRKIPPGAIPDSTVISFVYNKGGQEIEFTADKFPDDFDDSVYKFVKRYDKVVRKGNATPKINDFNLKTVYGNDTTEALLSEDKYQLHLFLKNDYDAGNWIQVLGVVKNAAEKKNIPGFIVTSIPIETLRINPPAVFTSFTPLSLDAVAIKTAARANPTLFLIKNGTVINKWSHADFEQALGVIQKLP